MPSSFPFEASLEELAARADVFVDGVFASLESSFLVMPRGKGFVPFAEFENGYEALKQSTAGFSKLDAPTVLATALRTPLVLIVLRAMLGFTPSEWAYVAGQNSGLDITQGFARTLDRRIRLSPTTPLRVSATMEPRVRALIEVACKMLRDGAPTTSPELLHRLDKADSQGGLAAARALAGIGVPYAMLLYERFLGRPFAGHRDSISELIGDVLELAIETELTNAGISFRKTRRAERVPGFDQAPDFIIPSEFNPQVVIEAKITEDDGTARDKVTRIQHLASLSATGGPALPPGFEVVACIGGRGFRQRREDMKKMLLATKGKVFTVKTLTKLIDHTRLKDFRAAARSDR
ncbi:MAG: hypothetical protein V7609_2192 [Verrucomicrobiota bacterium]